MRFEKVSKRNVSAIGHEKIRDLRCFNDEYDYLAIFKDISFVISIGMAFMLLLCLSKTLE